MLFSDETVAALCSSSFECAWESVRPVPRVDIDFGNSTKLTRTLNGNIATYFCTPDGRVLDVVPGLVDTAEFLRRARLATDLHATAKVRGDQAVRDYHARLAAEASAPASSPSKLRLADIAKGGVEVRIKGALKDGVAAAHGANEPETHDSVAADTDYNRAHRYARVHALLAAAPLPPPARITRTIYKDVLGVDLNDPFMGLAPYVLGGEGGRTTPNAQR